MQYRKKPVVIEAWQFNGHDFDEGAPEWYLHSLRSGEIKRGRTDKIENSDFLKVHTLEGDMLAYPGDYIIMGVKGERYPCRQDIFCLTYDKVEDGAQ